MHTQKCEITCQLYAVINREQKKSPNKKKLIYFAILNLAGKVNSSIELRPFVCTRIIFN